eukprot:gene13799-50130_t
MVGAIGDADGEPVGAWTGSIVGCLTAGPLDPWRDAGWGARTAPLTWAWAQQSAWRKATRKS